jgi:7,8-dihydropterin-6-yl-methyl-4-(beta-D-ribofuranosyl)aminobenzene 5'-phosphate synthase
MGDDDLPRERREQSLVLETTAGTAVLTGCAHPGIVEIVERAKEICPGDIDIALGGFHLKESDETSVSAVIKALRGLGVMRMGCSHCTGGPQTEMFQKAWQNDFVPFGCGARVRLQVRR